jgi:hypothetical protein
MRTADPPKIPTWLLAQFGCSPNNAAIIGDLNERYRGHSPNWYWRQAVVAIVVSLFKEVWSHKLLTVRALLIGWSTFFISRYAFEITREQLFALASWSRLWRHDWITLAVQIPEVAVSGVVAGWLVARLHRRSPKAMVMAYAAYFWGWCTVWFVRDLLRGTPFQSFLYGISFILITTVGILVGGLVAGHGNSSLERSRAGVG